MLGLIYALSASCRYCHCLSFLFLISDYFYFHAWDITEIPVIANFPAPGFCSSEIREQTSPDFEGDSVTAPLNCRMLHMPCWYRYISWFGLHPMSERKSYFLLINKLITSQLPESREGELCRKAGMMCVLFARCAMECKLGGQLDVQGDMPLNANIVYPTSWLSETAWIRIWIRISIHILATLLMHKFHLHTKLELDQGKYLFFFFFNCHSLLQSTIADANSHDKYSRKQIQFFLFLLFLVLSPSFLFASANMSLNVL